MTKNRQELLRIINNSPEPLTASDILQHLETQMDQATVYRGLHYLEENRLITSFHFTCDRRGGEQYYFKITKPHVHFFHCEVCHTFTPIDECILCEIEGALENKYGFTIKDHILHFTGICKNCSS